MLTRGIRIALGVIIMGLGMQSAMSDMDYLLETAGECNFDDGTVGARQNDNYYKGHHIFCDVYPSANDTVYVAGDKEWSIGYGMGLSFPLPGYVPVKGAYVAKWAICNGTMSCSLAKADNETPPSATRIVKTTDNIVTVNFEGVHNGTYIKTHDASMCAYLQLVSTGEKFRPSGLKWFCQDASPLPETPPKCTVNNENELAVTYNNIDLSSIGTSVDNSTSGDSVKMPTFSVTCERMSKEAVAKLSAMFVTMGGREVVKTSLDGLGVAVSLNDKPLGSGKTAQIQGGVTGPGTQTMRFQLVRDPSKKNLSGEFTASATLILTEQ